MMIPLLFTFVNRLAALSDFPFLAVFISHLWRSDFPQAAVYVPFWNGVNNMIRQLLNSENSWKNEMPEGRNC